MFNDNLKELRKSKGFTQEELATKINVVRQTVSKWEKGFSVPDADTLQKIADVLEVEVSQLLGAKIETEASKNEIAEQLSRINEQLVIKNRRAKKIWTAVCVILLLPVIIYIIMIILGNFFYASIKESGSHEIDNTVIEDYDEKYKDTIEE